MNLRALFFEVCLGSSALWPRLANICLSSRFVGIAEAKRDPRNRVPTVAAKIATLSLRRGAIVLN